MKRAALILGLAIAALGCGGGSTPPADGSTANVVYNLACVATCPATGETRGVALTACGADGMDPNAIAAGSVAACIDQARMSCADPGCACQASRTTQACTP